ncbi:acyl carrier protein [Allocatelliglobosispora scoriae]|uniref:Acyl carrier protein n=1 Tax=Allocatelliglobosispora scoriae TaxID=643052 RepID=A0A841C5L5_9ACTN|nr:phosphopantetheine-binding protein [Allocatelliglobosispora scoriae]MBB5874101.1 acyl carrier protein [Allocatelliglobosispora scoriae]
MERSEIVAVVESSIAEVRKEEVTGLTEETRLLEDLHLDSTSILELLMSLEDALNIEIDAQSLSMDDFATVGTLADYITTVLSVTA